MSNNALRYLIAGTLGATLALASPALAFHGGGGGGGMQRRQRFPAANRLAHIFLPSGPYCLR